MKLSSLAVAVFENVGFTIRHCNECKDTTEQQPDMLTEEGSTSFISQCFAIVQCYLTISKTRYTNSL